MKKVKFSIIIITILLLMQSAIYGQSGSTQKPSTQPYSTPSQSSPILPKPSQPPQAPPYSLNIVSFSASSNTINYGDEVTLRWNIVGRNLEHLKIEITPEIGAIPLSKTDYKNESFTIEGSKTIRPSKTEKYFLKVSAQDPMPRIDIDKTGHIHQTKILAEKTLIITVKKPRIENVKPLVDQKTMKIKFLAKNTGDGDFISSPIQVEYAVINNLYGPSLAEGKFTTPNLNIRVGEQVELGEITLNDREKALDGDVILIGVGIDPKYRLPLEKDADNYEHRWETKRFIIDNELISIFGGLLSGSIKINNYGECFGGTSGHSDTPYRQRRQKLTNNTSQCTPGDPYYRANDCYIAIMNNHQNFSLPRFEYTKGSVITYDYKGYVNDLNAKWEGKKAFSISKGKLKLEISFETEGTEVKGFEYTQGMYYDWSAPDYDFTKFNFTVYFKFGQRNKKLSYLDVEILPEIRGRFVGGYKILPDYIERDIDEKIKNEISKRLRELLMSESIRGKIEESIENKINSILRIHRIVDVKTEGDSIVIEYLPK